jgi:hypothetical protein
MRRPDEDAERMSRLVAALACAMAAAPALASADQPVVVPADDTRTHAVVLRRRIGFAATGAYLPETWAWFGQVALGPISWKLPLRGAHATELDQWSLRGRFGMFVDGEERTWAPITLAAQRISVHDVLRVPQYIHFQTGVEVAISSPWLSGRDVDPSAAGGPVFTADTELARNGWSVRPLSAHARIDVLICRSLHLEGGIGPELFRSVTEPARGNDFGLRWHASIGTSFACPVRSLPLSNLTWSVQYSARALLYNRDAPATYDDRALAALQYRSGWFSVGAFASRDLHVVGGRVQIDVWRAK